MCLYRHRLLPFFKGMDLIHAKKTAGFNRSEFFKPASHGVVLMIMTMSRIAMIIAPPRTKTSRLSELVCGSLLSFMLLLSGDSFRFGERPGMIGEGRCDSLDDKGTGNIKKKVSGICTRESGRAQSSPGPVHPVSWSAFDPSGSTVPSGRSACAEPGRGLLSGATI
jgi:hypothetical protein